MSLHGRQECLPHQLLLARGDEPVTMIPGDTIAAISSSAVPAARIILRISGPEAIPLTRTVCRDLPDTPSATRVRLAFSGLSFPAWAYVFLSPRSYTGEDLVELHLPGNVLLARMLLDELVKRGARHADPGEFTARAYFAGRIDLTEAEGVASMIHAQNEGELSAARQLLAGELARRVKPLVDRVADTLALVEVGIDFTDEDVTFISHAEVERHAKEIEESLRSLVADSARFERLAHEPNLVLVGRPNAGKSTLLNALAGTDRAVVSAVAGTTRDVISAKVVLPGGIVRLTDVAGLNEQDESGPSVESEIARKMRLRALEAVETADRVVLVRESGDDRPPILIPRTPDVLVLTKTDLKHSTPDPNACPVSAMTGEGMNALRERLSALAFGVEQGTTLALNARHLRAIDDARAALVRASRSARDEHPVEVLALDLRDALDSLGGISGQISPDDVLGRVFATFCIGK